jgi:hypothetical protein
MLYRQAIEDVAARFAPRPAIDLEMASTIIFVDRLASEHGKKSTLAEIAKQVKSLKPRLVEEDIRREASAMRQNGWVSATP